MHDDCSEIAFLGLESEAAYPKSDLTLTFLDLLWRHVEHAERSDGRQEEDACWGVRFLA